MQQRFSEIIQRLSPPKNSRFLLALSGGVDSMVLAHLLKEANIYFEAAHCNFNLRGKDADDDEAFVDRWCQENNIPLHFCNFQTSDYASEKKISIQMAARELRYDFFHSVMDEHELGTLLTAHHLDDALETTLINIGRGSGIGSVAGIRQKRDGILRPLLYFSKNEIIEFAKQEKINWREDASNADDKYQRNFLRLKVIPKLKEAFPNLSQSFAKTHAQLGDEAQLLTYFLDDKLAEIVTNNGNDCRLPLKKLKELPSTKTILHHWLKPFAIDQLDDIEAALNQDGNQLFESETHRLLVTADELIVEKKTSGHFSAPIQIKENTEKITFPVKAVFKKLPADESALSSDPAESFLDYSKLSFPLQLRPWQAGDKFTPLGMQQPKKLSDFLTDKKLNRFDKEKVWVLLSGNDIAWVVGHRISEKFKITNNTKTIYFAAIK